MTQGVLVLVATPLGNMGDLAPRAVEALAVGRPVITTRWDGAAELVGEGFEPDLVERVLRMTDAAEYKRRQYPPGPKISVRNFGRDRRLPITNRFGG